MTVAGQMRLQHSHAPSCRSPGASKISLLATDVTKNTDEPNDNCEQAATACIYVMSRLMGVRYCSGLFGGVSTTERFYNVTGQNNTVLRAFLLQMSSKAVVDGDWQIKYCLLAGRFAARLEAAGSKNFQLKSSSPRLSCGECLKPDRLRPDQCKITF